MVELAEIFRDYGPAYRTKFSQQLPTRHRQVMQAIEQCRTEALGGHVYYCDGCEETQYSYHSCKDRHCPKCQHKTAQQWLTQQEAFLLPVPHFMVTFTLPEGLRAVARRHQKIIYNLLFRASAAALQQLTHDPRFVGGQIGMVGVLQTWTRNLNYHPHIHYLVPAGGLAPDGQGWRPARNAFLVHVKPLSVLFRAKFRDGLRKTDLFEQVPAETWHQAWVVHCQPVGSGAAALKYLANYMFRVAISNNRIIKVENDQVTFRYKASDTGKTKYCTLTTDAFMRRFLQHVLPKGFMKIRYYGLFSPGKRHLLDKVRHLLAADDPVEAIDLEPAEPTPSELTLRCPNCGQPMRMIDTIKPKRCRPP